MYIGSLILIAGIAAYAAFLLFPVIFAMVTSKSLMESAKAYEQHPNSPSKRILVVGDSTAVGVGTSDPKYSTAGRLGADFPDADIDNIAVSGDKLEDLEKVLDSISNRHYDVILVQIGANDIVGLTSYSKIRERLISVLKMSLELGDKVVILTAGDIGDGPVFKWPFSTYVTHRALKVRSIFMEETGKYENIRYIDLFEKMKKTDFNADIPRYYADDHFHLADQGYGLWYEEIKREFDTLVAWK